jgi:LysR family transcriptional activator of glutamate synthase operon
VPTAHRLARRSSLALAEVIDEGFIAMQSEFGLRQTTDAMFARRGTQPRIVLESAEIATIKALVGSGLGVAITPGGGARSDRVGGRVHPTNRRRCLPHHRPGLAA